MFLRTLFEPLVGAESDLRSGPVHVESQTAPLCSPLQCVTVSQLEFHKLLVFLVHACNVPSAHISVLLFLRGPAGGQTRFNLYDNHLSFSNDAFICLVLH